MIYHRNSRSSHYSYTELFLHVSEVKKIFPTATGGIKHGQATLTLFLRPTKDSIEYTVKLYAKQGSKSVKVFVVNPEIKYTENRKKVPHLYSDGSLCLHYIRPFIITPALYKYTRWFLETVEISAYSNSSIQFSTYDLL